MRCKLVNIIVVFSLLFLCSCRVEMPKDVIPPDKMEAILYDYHLVQSMEGVAYTSGDYKGKLFYRGVFDKHHVTKEMFDSALVWYNRNPKYMVEIYENLESRMQREVNALASLKSSRVYGVDLNFAHLNSNISELWTSHNVRMLSAVPLNNKLAFSFTTPKDSTFVTGDSLSFSFNTMFISPLKGAVNQQAYAAVYVEYTDNTVGSYALEVDSSGHYELHVPRNYKSRLKSMDGYVYYCDDDTTNESKLVVSDISLRRLHPVQSKSSAKNR
ncbi:MAG: DUF4296 domain-containing protein [Bacteroidaceae bacterium]|nr:DUF4296 domain-containing protein [Bacteroidaceae bacterium]